MKIGFIGAGKVANAFSMYLGKHDIKVDYVHSKTKSSALNMAKLTASSYCENIKILVENCDVIFITTSDSEISNVSSHIAKEFKNNAKELDGKTFVHMSGALTSDEFYEIKNIFKNIYCYSLHPLQSFAEYSKALIELEETVFSIEGDILNENIRKILESIKNEIIYLSKESKTKYHIGACIASNYLITLLDSSLELFSQIGIERSTAIKSLMPLINGALSNFQDFKSEVALTGPIKRGDFKTIEHHVDDLSTSEFKELYMLMGRYTLALASKSGTDKVKLDEIESLLR